MGMARANVVNNSSVYSAIPFKLSSKFNGTKHNGKGKRHNLLDLSVEKQRILSLFQVPGFRHGSNSLIGKSKIQNPTGFP